jgi:hypothetical protein
MSDRYQHTWEYREDHWFCTTCGMRAHMSVVEHPDESGCFVPGGEARGVLARAEKAEAEARVLFDEHEAVVARAEAAEARAEKAEAKNDLLWRCIRELEIHSSVCIEEIAIERDAEALADVLGVEKSEEGK